MNKSFLSVAMMSLLPYASFSVAQTLSANETMVVTANRFEQVHADNLSPTVVVTREDITRMQAKSLVDVFRILPSIEIAQYGGRGQTASIHVRGGSSSQVLVLVDGVRMPKAMMGEVDFSQVPITGIERIEYIRGARATIYGSEAISGVINIITRADIRDSAIKIHAGFGSHQYHVADLSLSQPVSENGHIKAVIGYEKTDGFNVKPMSGINDGDEHGFESFHTQLGYQHHWLESIQLYLGATAYNNEYDYDQSSYANADWKMPEIHLKKTGRVEYRGVNAHLRIKEQQWVSEFGAAYGKQDNYDFNANSAKRSGDYVEIEQTNASWLNSYQFMSGFSLGAGVDFRREKLTKGYTYGSTYNPSENPRDNVGISMLAQYHLNNWTVEASARSDDNSQYGRFNTWQAGIGWQFLTDYKLVLSYGTAFRAPSFVDLYYPGAEVPTLEPEESKNIEVSLTYDYEWFNWGVTAYQNTINHMLIWDNNAGSWGAMQNIGEAEIKGLEFALGLESGAVHHQFYLDFKDPINKSGEENERLANRAKRNFKWNASIDIEDWTLGTQYLYQSDRLSSGTTLGGYSLWNLTAEYAFSSQFLIQGKVDNVFNKKYEMYSGYASPEREYTLSLRYQF
ncbi:TonB-dependent receptor [Vibrio cincinnatiensis]|uniref:TonB-dependent receptor domain-containing protein n=1 Tax=Vibrio cincinnatiensis TaxID=675 RepID=UPI001EDE03AF|nr:TonB-dependent receptor [Vibrio cincinnatiensis]MCG3737554.1 TonB-dependent receptor [Vibrio cincinnatiensis]MCG3746520.1 TonB-dependent receptor [Vibrio cincinnatiensis]